jgi:hypothetical protein
MSWSRLAASNDSQLRPVAAGTLLPCVLSDLPELELCDEVRTTLEREIGSMDERIASLRASRKILAGYLGSRPKAAFGGSGASASPPKSPA